MPDIDTTNVGDPNSGFRNTSEEDPNMRVADADHLGVNQMLIGVSDQGVSAHKLVWWLGQYCVKLAEILIRLLM